MSETPSWLPANAVTLPIAPKAAKPTKKTAATKDAYPWHGAVKEPVSKEHSDIVSKVVEASANGTLPTIPQTEFTHHKTVESYSVQQLIDRERFVSEYLFDFSGRRAAIRCGYKESTASAIAHNFLSEPGVQRLIREHMQAYDVSAITKGRVMAGLLKEATNEHPTASHAARVAAWRILGNVVGLGDNGPKDDRPKGGVMVVPATPVEAEWENVAAKSQEALKNSVRE